MVEEISRDARLTPYPPSPATGEPVNAQDEEEVRMVADIAVARAAVVKAAEVYEAACNECRDAEARLRDAVQALRRVREENQ